MLDKTKQEILEKLVSLDPDAGQPNQYKWDDEYQRLVVAMLLTDRYFLVQSLDLVQPKYFLAETHQLIVRVLFEHFQTYKSMPSKIIMRQYLLDRLKNRDQAYQFHFIGELETLYTYYVDGLENKEALLEKIVTFAKVTAMKIAIHKCVEGIQSNPESDETWHGVREIFREAMLVDRKFDIGLDYFQTFEDRYARMAEAEETTERFTTGFDALDWGLTGGGLSKGEIGAWMALPGVGKSLALAKAAVMNLNRSKKVLYISLEMDQDKIAERFDAMLTLQPINKLMDRKEFVFTALREHILYADDKRTLIIKQFPGGSCDVNTIRAYHSQLQLHGFKPDLLIVDYVGEMKDTPGVPTWESRYRILRDLRGFGVEEGHCTLTALQPNRQAVEAQMDGFMDESKLGDSFNQNRPLDALWTINQTPREKNAGVARIFVAKHRNGKSRYSFKVSFDYKEAPDGTGNTLRIDQITDDKYKYFMSNVTDEVADAVEIDVVPGDRNKKKSKWDPTKSEE